MTIGDRLWGSGSSSNGDPWPQEDEGSQDGDTRQQEAAEKARSGTENHTSSNDPDDPASGARSAPPLEIALSAASKGTRMRVANFKTYWQDQRLAGYFMIYSVLVTILLAGLAVFTDDTQLMINVLLMYGFSSIPFFVWLGHAVDSNEEDDIWP